MKLNQWSTSRLRRIEILLLLLAFTLTASCSDTEWQADPADGDLGDTDAGDSDLIDLDDGDPIEGEAEFEVDIELSEVIPTVATVTWSVGLEHIDSARVEFGLETDYGLVAPSAVSGNGPFEVVLIGMKPLHDYHVRVVATSEGERYASDDHTITTGPAPSSLPDLSVSISEAESSMAAGGYLVTSIFAVPAAAVIIDGDGDYVWWHLDEEENFLVCRSRLATEAGWVYYWSPNVFGGGRPGGTGGGGDEVAEQRLTRVSLDGTVVEEVGLEQGHHDFVILSDGTLTYIEYDIRNIGGHDIQGDRVMELSPDGTTREVFNIWDQAEYSRDPSVGEGWSHANFISYDEDEEAYYLSFRSFNSVYKFDRRTGDLIWVMGGADSDFELSSGSTNIFTAQHGLHPLGETLLVFDNGEPPLRTYSQLLEVSWDESTGVVETEWSYVPNPTLFNYSHGNVHRFESGNTLATYSNLGLIEEVTPDGEVVWRINAALGGATGYSEYMEALYETD